MFSQDFMQAIVDGVVKFATDLLMPGMLFFFVAAMTLRCLIYYTVMREDWFSREFSKRVKKFMAVRDDKAEQSFFILSKRLLEITYYEVFEVRSILKRRNPDAIMTMTDRIFLVQQGSARLVSDALKQLKYLKFNSERPKFLEIANGVFRNNPCFNKVFGLVPVSIFNDFLNTVPGLFIVGGIFGTFLGIMVALPELGGMNLSDVEGSKLIMDNFLLKISFSMSTSIAGIILSVSMQLANTFFSAERIYMETVERFEGDLDMLWNMSTSNKLPAEISNFEADRDPIEALAEDLIAKELSVEVGFIAISRPISKWWGKVGKTNHIPHPAATEAAKIAAAKKAVKEEVKTETKDDDKAA